MEALTGRERLIFEGNGAEGIRTPDPHNAIVVLYQLSYDPILYRKGDAKLTKFGRTVNLAETCQNGREAAKGTETDRAQFSPGLRRRGRQLRRRRRVVAAAPTVPKP